MIERDKLVCEKCLLRLINVDAVYAQLLLDVCVQCEEKGIVEVDERVFSEQANLLRVLEVNRYLVSCDIYGHTVAYRPLFYKFDKSGKFCWCD